MSEESTSYEFCITVVGVGADVDAAFQDAIDSLKENPNEVIKGEVIYVRLSKDDSFTDEDEIIDN